MARRDFSGSLPFLDQRRRRVGDQYYCPPVDTSRVKPFSSTGRLVRRLKDRDSIDRSMVAKGADIEVGLLM